jgi:hypothetical protein
MNAELEKYQGLIERLPKFLIRFIEKQLKKDPKFRALIEEEDRKVRTALEHSLKPYDDRFSRHVKIPKLGIPRSELLSELRTLHELESPRWEQ